MGSRNGNDQSPLSPAAFHILLALSEGPIHGYAVMQRIAEAGLKVGPGTIYGALHRMQESGWVVEAGTEAARGPLKQRQRYRLTTEGSHVLRIEATRLVRTADLIRTQNVPLDEAEG